MEPKTQVEIQLGHMCNNRCVFCVSGQETALGRARPLPLEPILEQIRAARAQGHAKITLLGGEPTLQPAFLDVVREAVRLGFEEIVIFTNGVKTARAAFVDEILATGGNFTFRFSIQGATEEAHERTTRKDGSFARIVQSMQHVAARGAKLTVNMCVVQSNFASVDRFPELLLPLGASQLHLDMIRPLDAGQRTEEELAAMIPRYSDLVAPLTRMAQGFPEDFDVNIGNLPYCVAPELAPITHHDGEKTMTIAVDGEKKLSKPWDKYLVKRRDKSKPESCRTCVLDARCNGIFDKYREIHGTSEFTPVTAARLLEADPLRKLFSVHARALLSSALPNLILPPPFEKAEAEEIGERCVELRLLGPDPLILELRPRSEGEGIAALSWLSLWPKRLPQDRVTALASLQATWKALATQGDPIHPPGEDAITPLARSLTSRLRLLRQRAPFTPLRWTDLHILEHGRRAELRLESPTGEEAWIWLAESAGRPTGGYRTPEARPSAAIIEGLGAIMATLRPPPSKPGVPSPSPT